MTAEHRLARIEETLSPTQLVLRWLAQAHGYGDIESYVGSLLAADSPVAPLDRLVREAAHGARTAMRGKRPELVEATIRSALRETVFRFELVMRINVTAHEILEREELLDSLFTAQLALLASEDAKGRADPTYPERLARVVRLLGRQVGELAAAQQARTTVEGRYLDGHEALFADVAAAWAQRVRSTKRIADTANRLAELDGVSAAVQPDPEVLSRRTAELVADLVEPAKAEALDKLGEGRQALGIAAGWVRAKLAPKAITADELVAGEES
ncbi:MAG: hypothetical protein ABSA21_13665 [Candidatus Limnocylindrales bacterium]|jgi:hypothetical protein